MKVQYAPTSDNCSVELLRLFVAFLLSGHCNIHTIKISKGTAVIHFHIHLGTSPVFDICFAFVCLFVCWLIA